jgi:TetR/AcrR family transcriptional repressor of bet genes
MTRATNTDERKQQITRGLQAVMAKKGYDGASIHDVAKAAGLTAGLVHYHFANKLQILLALLEGIARLHLEHLDEAIAQAAGDPERELHAFIDAHLATGKTADPEALACWVMLSGEALREKKVRERYDAVLQEIAARAKVIVDRGAKTKVFAARDRDAAVAAIVAAIQGYYLLGATARGLIPRGSAARTLKKMTRGLLERSTQ